MSIEWESITHAKNIDKEIEEVENDRFKNIVAFKINLEKSNNNDWKKRMDFLFKYKEQEKDPYGIYFLLKIKEKEKPLIYIGKTTSMGLKQRCERSLKEKEKENIKFNILIGVYNESNKAGAWGRDHISELEKIYIKKFKNLLPWKRINKQTKKIKGAHLIKIQRDIKEVLPFIDYAFSYFTYWQIKKLIKDELNENFFPNKWDDYQKSNNTKERDKDYQEKEYIKIYLETRNLSFNKSEKGDLKKIHALLLKGTNIIKIIAQNNEPFFTKIPTLEADYAKTIKKAWETEESNGKIKIESNITGEEKYTNPFKITFIDNIEMVISTCANFIRGCTNNGWDEWKDFLREILSKDLNPKQK